MLAGLLAVVAIAAPLALLLLWRTLVAEVQYRIASPSPLIPPPSPLLHPVFWIHNCYMRIRIRIRPKISTHADPHLGPDPAKIWIRIQQRFGFGSSKDLYQDPTLIPMKIQAQASQKHGAIVLYL